MRNLTRNENFEIGSKKESHLDQRCDSFLYLVETSVRLCLVRLRRCFGRRGRRTALRFWSGFRYARIGWGCVVLGIVLEVIYKLGIGNIIATVSGFSTLLIASFLADSGDTFTVL